MGRTTAASGIPAAATLPELLAQAVDDFGPRPALRFFGRVTSYTELSAQIDAVAAGLAARGVTAGDRIALVLPNTPTFAVYFFAAQRLGAVVVNANPLQDAEALAAQIDDAGAGWLVTLDLAALFTKAEACIARRPDVRLIVASFAALLPPARSVMYRLKRGRDLADPTRSPYAAQIIPEAALLARQAPLPPVPTDPATLAVLQYTGGTTGTPKAVALTHGNLAANVAQLRAWASPRVRPGEERLLGVLPLFHIFGLTGVLLYGLANGAEITLLPRFDVARLVETMREVAPTLLPGVPSLFATLLDHPAAEPVDLTGLTLALSGGAPLSRDLAARFEARAGIPLLAAYGLAEAAPAIACAPLSGNRSASAVGPPLTDTMVSIRDHAHPERDLPAGVVGEICVRGPQIMSGYWQRPEATRAAFVDGFLRTGDLGSLDRDGHLLVVDRIADVLVRAGTPIYPHRIEEALCAHPAVAEAVVIGLPDAAGAGQVPVAYVALRAGHTASPAEIIAAIAPHLSIAEVPVQLEIHETLPKTVIGKVSRQAVRDLARATERYPRVA